MKQDDLEELSHCPLCAKGNFSLHVRATDFLVSRETFNVLKCHDCGFLFTNPRPVESSAGRFYKSIDYVSHSDSSKGVINKLFKIARIYTLAMKVSFVKRMHPAAKSILDYGCGTGDFLSEARKAGLEVMGIEIDAEARAIAAGKNKVQPLFPIELKNLPAAQFDLVTLWHVLEHVYALDETINTLKHLLKPGGKMIIAVPNAASFDNNLYGASWAAWDVPRHIYHFKPKDMERLMNKNGLAVIKIKPLPLDGFYIAMLSEKNKDGILWFPLSILKGVFGFIVSLLYKTKSSSLVYVAEVRPSP